MTETMLVRAAGGGWEELRPQTTMPDGGIVEVFGEDIGPVLGASTSVVVAACSPPISGGLGSPDAICLDPEGGVWIVQLALDGTGDATLPQLLTYGGALNGMNYDAFQALCDRTGGDPLSTFLESRADESSFDRDSFEASVTEALAHGRFKLVAIVREAAPALVQAMRFLNASGAMGSLYEATSFASPSVSAVRAKAVDVGTSVTRAPAVTAATGGSAGPTAAAAASGEMSAAGFVASTGKVTDAATSKLMAQLQKACVATFDDVIYGGTATDATMDVVMNTSDGPSAMIVASSDGAVVMSFEALGDLDPDWTVRSELCQGMERLLGADLGDVRKISQLNLSIAEHLMDATLMEALCDLLGDTVRALHGGDSATGARTGAREPAAA